VPSYPFVLDPGESLMRELGTLYGRSIGDEAATLYYKLRVDRKAIQGDSELKLKYTFDDGKTWVLLDPFVIRVQSIDATVGITRIKSIPTKIEPGKSARVIVTLRNLADSVMEDISLKFDLTSDDMPFAPVNSTSEKKVRSLGAGESVDYVFDLLVLGDAASQVYKVPIVLSYADETGKLYNKSDILALVVGTRPDIAITIDDQEFYSSGSAGEITIKFVNKDVTDVKFLNVELMPSDDFDVFSTSSVYLGDLDSDDYESADFKVFVKGTDASSVKIPLKLDYKDANNEAFVQNVELNLRLYSKTEMKQFGLVQSSNTMGIVIILVIVVGGIYLYRKKKKKKKKK